MLQKIVKVINTCEKNILFANNYLRKQIIVLLNIIEYLSLTKFQREKYIKVVF